MTFLHAALLGGMALVAVPIILHLVMRRQPRHLEFPALRFIQQRRDANRRRLQLRHLLLLLLRCAVICLLAFALARPTMQAAGMLGDQEAPVAAALVFDTSARMGYRERNQTRLEQGQETAQWLLAQLPSGSDVAVLDSRTGSAVFAVDVGAARQRIERLDTTAVALPLPTIIEDALRLVSQSELPRKEVYIFTDLGQSVWSGSAAQGLQRRLEEYKNVGIYLIDVGVKQPRNLALGEIKLSSQVVAKNSPLRIDCEVSQVGGGDERTVELYLEDENHKLTKRGGESVALAGDETRKLEFHPGSLAAGVHQGYVEIAGDDALGADNRRYFTVQIKPAWRVLIVAPDKAEDYALFLSEALAPYSMRLKGEAAFECDVANLSALTERPLSQYAAVCILDPTPLAPEAWRELASYASQGGGVAIFLGRNAKPLESFNDVAAQSVLPARLERQWRSGERELYLAPDNLQHPLLAKFRALESGIPWDAFPIFRHWELGPLAKGVGVLIAYSNNLPALVERPLGKGRVLVMTTPISDAANRRDAWNVLPTGDEPWPFVMLSNEMLAYLVGSGETRLNYLPGETAVLHLSAGEQHPQFLIETPKGDKLRQSSDEQQASIIVSATDTPGNYRLRAGGDADKVDLGFSVNYPTDISQLQRANNEQIKAIFGEAPYQLARDRSEINRSVNRARVGIEWYPYLIVIVSLLLAAEQILSNKFYRNEDSGGPKLSARQVLGGSSAQSDRQPSGSQHADTAAVSTP